MDIGTDTVNGYDLGEVLWATIQGHINLYLWLAAHQPHLLKVRVV